MSKGSGTVIVKMSDPKIFTPKLTVRVSAVAGKKNTFLLQIIHPNKTEGVVDPKTGQLIQDKRTGKFKKIGKVIHSEEVVNNNPDQLKAFLEVKATGDVLIKTEYAHIRTDYEEILHIPAGKKGKMKMKTMEAAKKGLEEAYSDEVDAASGDEEVELMSDDEDFLGDDITNALVGDLKIDLPDSDAPVSKTKKASSKAKKESKVKEKIKNNTKNNKKIKNKKEIKTKKNNKKRVKVKIMKGR